MLIPFPGVVQERYRNRRNRKRDTDVDTDVATDCMRVRFERRQLAVFECQKCVGAEERKRKGWVSQHDFGKGRDEMR